MDKIEILKGKSIFVGLSDEELEQLANLADEEKYSGGCNIVSENDLPDNIYIIVSGKVEIIKTHGDNNDKIKILATLSAGDSFGEMSLLDGKTSPATVSAIEDCKIISVSATDFHKYLLRNEKVLLQIINVLCARLRQVWQTQSMSSSTADARIRMGIHQLAEKHGIRDARGTIIDLKITHQELAEMVGTSRETVTRVLAHLRKKGIIEINQRRIILLDDDALLREI